MAANLQLTIRVNMMTKQILLMMLCLYLLTRVVSRKYVIHAYENSTEKSVAGKLVFV